MTREEALNILHNASVYHPNYLDALNMAIEALEQETVIDKIRAEIEEHAKINQNLNTDRARTLCWCLNIIDKYKAETESQKSEDKE